MSKHDFVKTFFISSVLTAVTLFIIVFVFAAAIQRPVNIKEGKAVNLPGDCGGPNGTPDGFVDLFDYGNLSRSFGLTQGQPGFNAACDFYQDTHNIIDLLDYGILAQNFGRSGPTGSSTSTPTPIPGGNFNYVRLSNPERTEVRNRSDGSWIATFTNNSYTVTLAGSSRTFSESTTPHTVTHNIWVRVLPAPFSGSVDENWLTHALSDTTPDIIGLHFQYVSGASPIVNQQGLQIAGDAHYGAAEGADFNDYLGVTWTYPDGTVDPAESNEFRSLDCSGYTRMVFGYRAGLPLSRDPRNGTTIPRRSFEIYAYSPGIIIIPKTNSKPTNYDVISVGDLVFFDSGPTDGQLDHVGMFLGKDSGNHYRFISSRKSSDGPTITDQNGTSTLDGSGYFPDGFRSARRL